MRHGCLPSSTIPMCASTTTPLSVSAGCVVGDSTPYTMKGCLKGEVFILQDICQPKVTFATN